jgi:hypothetical protein
MLLPILLAALKILSNANSLLKSTLRMSSDMKAEILVLLQKENAGLI